MATSNVITERTCLNGQRRTWGPYCKDTWWMQHREATLNWLALGLLLAAWNASDESTTQEQRRPQTLRGYAYVSVRAATLDAEQRRTASTN